MPESPAGTRFNEKVVEVLSGLGLTGTELRAYQLLLKTSGATPTVVARETGQSRGRVYKTLRLLVERGLAREEPTRPIRYIPVPLTEVLAVAAAETNRKSMLLQELYATYSQAAAAPVAPAPASLTRPEDVSMLTGRRAIAAEMRRMLSQAKQFFRLCGGGALPDRLASYGELLRDMQRARARGVQVELRLASTGDQRARRVIEGELGEGVVREIPAVAAPPVTYVATESAALTVVAQPDNDAPLRGDDVGIAARSTPLIHAVLAAMDPESAALLPMGRDQRPSAQPAVIPELDPKRVGLQFLESLARADRRIQGMGPSGWSRFMEQGWEATLGVYAAAKRRGVLLQALTTDRPEERPFVERFGALWEIRVASWIPAWVVIIDGRELYQAFVVGENGGSPPELRHSTDPQEVRFYKDLFERLWERARPLPRMAVVERRA